MLPIPPSHLILTLTLFLERNRQCNCNINTYHTANLQKERHCTSGYNIYWVSYHGDMCLTKSCKLVSLLGTIQRLLQHCASI